MYTIPLTLSYMKLNNELRTIFKPLGDYIKEVLEKREELNEGVVVNFYAKKPHIFYPKVSVYLEIDGYLIEITEMIENNKLLGDRWIKDMMSKAHFNYFTHYNQEFNKPYYKVGFQVNDKKLKIQYVDGTSSPDPIDKNGTVIRK